MNNTFYDQNLAQASNLLAKGNTERAINIFNVLSAKFPKNSQVFHYLLQIYLIHKSIWLIV